MKTAAEVVAAINAAHICAPERVEDVLGDAIVLVRKVDEMDHDEYDEYKNGNRLVYTVATVVFQMGDEFFGVRGPVECRFDSMTFEECRHNCRAFEMVQVPSVTYRKK